MIDLAGSFSPVFQVNETIAGDQRAPAVVQNTDGGFFVTWETTGADGVGSEIFARAFDADGSPVAGEFRVNAHTEGTQAAPSMGALDEGRGFFVAWESQDQDGDGLGVFAQQFDSDGNALGATVIAGTDADDTLRAEGSTDEILEGGGGDDTLAGGDGSDTLDGEAGRDTVDYAYNEQFGATGNIVVDLAAGTGIDGFGHTDTLIGIERVIGTPWNDDLTGRNGQADFLRGGQGDDTITGGTGTDMAEYLGDRSNYVISGDAIEATVSGLPGIDMLFEIERLAFSDQTVFLVPNQAPALSTPDLAGVSGVAVAAGDLAQPSDPDDDAIGVWSFQDQTFGGGRFEISGLGDPVFEGGSFKFKDGDDVLVTITGGINTDIPGGLANDGGTVTVVSGSLSHVTFVPGTAGGIDTLSVQVEDEFGLASPWETLTFSTVSPSLANGYLSEVLSSGNNRGSDFGASVALSADGLVALVGAPENDLPGALDQDAAYVYRWDGAAWSETRLTASDGGALDCFGSAVALSAFGAPSPSSVPRTPISPAMITRVRFIATNGTALPGRNRH